MKLEEIIPLLGNLGRYQIFVITYMCVLAVMGCLHTLGDVFYTGQSDHWCRVLPDEDCSGWPEFEDNCTAVKRSLFLPPPEKNDSKYPYSNCYQWQVPAGYQFDPYTPLSQAENFTSYMSIPCQDGWEYDTSQYQTTTINDFDLVCDDSNLPSLAQSIHFVGFLVGSFIFGSISDLIGRKKSVFIALCLYVAAFISTTFSVSIYMYMAMRFLSGCGSIGAYISLYILVLEFVGSSWRTAVTMIIGMAYAVGYFVLAVMAMNIKQWRHLCIAFSASTVLLFVPLLFVQESISWLLSKGKVDEAEAVIRSVAKFNKKTVPDVLFSKQEIQELRESRDSAIPPSVIDLYRTPNMAVKTLNMQYNWIVNSLVYFGLSQSTGDLGVDEYWAFFVSGAVEIPALLYAAFGVERFGRKWNTSILELIGGAACLATIFIPDGIWKTVVSMLGKFCISATFSIVYLYSTELFPTPVRTVGLGVCSVASRLGGILSPIILLLGDTVTILPLLLFGSSAVLAGLLALFLPETRGRRLPQTLAEGEEMGKCRCMGGQDQSEAEVELTELETTDKEGAFAAVNPAFDSSEENQCAAGGTSDFAQQFPIESAGPSHT